MSTILRHFGQSRNKVLAFQDFAFRHDGSLNQNIVELADVARPTMPFHKSICGNRERFVLVTWFLPGEFLVDFLEDRVGQQGNVALPLA